MPLLIVFLGIMALLLLMLRFRLNAFIALTLVSLAVGVAEGMSPPEVVTSIENGIGSTLGSLVLILGFGSMLGVQLAESGAAQRITSGLIRRFGPKHVQWAVVLTGFIVGIPMFYAAGFVVLIPIIFTLAATTRLPLLYVGIPMVASLSVTHGFLPPHPGPTAIAVIYKADIGLTLVYGILLAIPTIILAGPFFARTLGRIKAQPPANLFDLRERTEDELPSMGVSLFTALVPVVLIAVAAVADLLMPAESPVRQLIDFLGNPSVSLLLAILIAIYTLGLRRGRKIGEIMDSLVEAVKSIAMILFIIGGGGAFKQVLIDSGVGDYLTEQLQDTSLSPLLLAWGIAAVLRIALGSATVAALTTAGLVLPLIEAGSVSPELMVLATGAGSLTLSNVNDSGFWMFKEYFGLSVGQTFASWSVMETIVSVIGLLGVLLLDLWV
ncbi:Gnt-I system high-affinity gluconate transporter/Gnt-II system L-idonate transporter [Catalinimonas alkaloidigena]|uniref:Gnt-I system high-affinity gluconate transporter/Gnt-II system L-idonate transporter n=1 Tax=Catalinimonas alkaloidigena TaxID=1075417 RepID=A0A1G8WVX3_9BACT|nr:gluconate:H+ symporter [Catalinimonas alkaloidigena]SDJ82351.1 Gnt-I system high-affinity gluconate transporter/Gnt-II system L-idonate transporter [Catalinimonas alkaloidigena]